MLPLIALLISSSDGFLFVAISAAACMIWPAWQYPHCGTFKARQAFCTGWLPCASSPSIVVTDRPEASFTAVVQGRGASPPALTEDGPHSCTPAPAFLPPVPQSARSIPDKRSTRIPSTTAFLPP